ncbi:MAG: GAF domain-containing protein [Anaerolineae bacterium]|nr:GAF domain-containing protein [Anaerolineae bacterium]
MPEETSAGQNKSEGLQQKVDMLNRLVEISLVMNSTFQLDPLLEYLMFQATEITNSESASILLLDDKTGDLRFAAALGDVAEELIGMIVPRKGSIAGSIIDQEQAMIIDDVDKDPRHFDDIDQKLDYDTRSILGVPMAIRDKLVGVLEVLNRREGRYDEDDIRYITLLASQAAVAIDNVQMVESLEHAYDDLEKVNKLKTDFIAIASHELRTPLGVILGYATVLQEDAQGESGEHIEAVLSSALQMRSLIEGMTNLRYVSLDESELNFEKVWLNDVLQEAINDVQSMVEAKGQIFELEEPPEAVMIEIDRAKFVLALTNVLNNAIKFTPPGGVILLSAVRRNKEVWVRVRDNGIGIPADELEQIFEQFYQVEDPMTRKHGGLGLGLTIARTVLDRHKGRIWAESPGPNEGSCFTLVLPLPPGMIFNEMEVPKNHKKKAKEST